MEAKGTRLVRRENGVWYIVRTGNSRGISTRTRDLGAAEATLALYIQGKDRQDKVASGLTVHQALDDYIAEHVEPNVASKDIILLAADYFRVHFPVDKLVADITEEDIDDPRTGLGYIQRRQNRQIVLKNPNPRPAAPGSLRREIGALAAAIKHAARKRRLPKTDIPHLPRPAPPPPKDRWLTQEEEQQLVAACPVDEADEMRRRSENIRRALGSREVAPAYVYPADRPARLTRIYRFLMLGLETAARKEALETLTWFQVDFRVGTIDLNPPGRAQTNKRRAVVRMSKRLRAVLVRAFKEKASEWVLDHPGNVRASFMWLARKSGIKGVTPHTLRHTWATRAAQAGVSMREIADWLGDNITTVEKNYYKRSPHYLKDAVDWREREQASSTEPDR